MRLTGDILLFHERLSGTQDPRTHSETRGDVAGDIKRETLSDGFWGKCPMALDACYRKSKAVAEIIMLSSLHRRCSLDHEATRAQNNPEVIPWHMCI